jgi:endonuclease/exonuclease/phosphatase family metal-dependent hydrolase
MSKNIKVVSFNIEFCASVTRGYWQYVAYLWKYFLPHNINAIQKIAEAINKEEIDIATFTELEGQSYRTHHQNYMNVISQLAGLKTNAFYPVSYMGFIGSRGNGIATKYDIIDAQNLKLESTMESRYLSISTIKMDDVIVHVLTTQLALGIGSRKKELEHIARVINSISGPIIFTGDLNTQREKELDILLNTRLRRIETPKTFPSWKPNRRIDYIYYSPEFELVNGYALEDLKASDHLPIVAEFKLIDDYNKKIFGKKIMKKVKKKVPKKKIVKKVAKKISKKSISKKKTVKKK